MICITVKLYTSYTLTNTLYIENHDFETLCETKWKGRVESSLVGVRYMSHRCIPVTEGVFSRQDSCD